MSSHGITVLSEIAPRVLVVEDDASLRDTLRMVLEDEGFDVSTADNGRSALQCMRDSLPDIVLLDLTMPEMNGWQFRLEQRADARLADVPIVAFSADVSAQARTIDAQLFLAKPVNVSRLVAGLRETLRAARIRQLTEQDRLASLGTLVAGIAHEVNNPLTAVLNNVHVLRERVPLLRGEDGRRVEEVVGELLPEIEEMLAEVEAGAARIRDIMRQVRVFSSSDDVKRVPLQMEDIVRKSVLIAEPELREHARLSLELHETPAVLAGAAQLGQLVLNLLLNASQAIVDGPPEENEVKVSTRLDGGLVVLEVSDSGCGIPPEIRSRIFDPFFTTRPIGSGTGLGLAVVHSIVHGLGGTVEFESGVGHGTTFRVRLPPISEARAL